MRRSKMYIRYMVAVTAWLVALMFGCRPIERLSAFDVENRQVDSLVTYWLDSASSCPVKAKDHLLVFRSQVKDSINFYKLSAVCGLCYYHIGQLDSARLFTEAAQPVHSTNWPDCNYRYPCTNGPSHNRWHDLPAHPYAASQKGSRPADTTVLTPRSGRTGSDYRPN